MTCTHGMKKSSKVVGADLVGCPPMLKSDSAMGNNEEEGRDLEKSRERREDVCSSVLHT